MSLIYKPVQSNMACEDGEKKWYPHLIKMSKRVTTEVIAEEIMEKSSLSRGDVHSVILNLFDRIHAHLLDSKTVHLNGFGTFTLKAHSAGNGVSTPEEVSPAQINHLTVQFTPYFKRNPATGIKYPMFKGVEFEHIDNIGGRKKNKANEKENLNK